MTPEQIKALLDKYGIENLMFIALNNNKRLHVDDELRGQIEWDDANEMMYIKQSDYVLHEMRDFSLRNVVICHPYVYFETFIFATDDDSRLTFPQK